MLHAFALYIFPYQERRWDRARVRRFHLTYALKSDGSVVGWGVDGAGQVSGIPSGTNFTAIAAGYYTGYALLVPEPASAALLGLGGLMLLRQRRRWSA